MGIEMRVMLCGSEGKIQKLTRYLAGTDIEIVSTSDASNVMGILAKENCGLAIVDSLMEEARSICHCIRELCDTRVVALLGLDVENWEIANKFECDGYISENMSPVELAARLRAVMRSKTS